MNHDSHRPPSLLAQQERRVTHPSHAQKRWYIGLFLTAILLIVGATLSWILSILGILPSPWSALFPAIFAGLGCLVALFDSFLKIMEEQ